MSTTTKLWIALGTLLGVTFLVLLGMGREIYHQAPPVPERVVDASGATIFTRADIDAGREVWQSFGGQQLGSIWGHGALVAPDWSADWLHREATAMLDGWARDENASSFSALEEGAQESLKARLRKDLRANTYDPSTETLTVSHDRARAIAGVAAHYESV
ncbi:MAG TPA: nitric-oxide reductase large subunit, partial [Rhodanobacteraceae bacterium]|nr:nitric-oxide reductase large subunit [Rhodanobacteraceae bacterium]